MQRARVALDEHFDRTSRMLATRRSWMTYNETVIEIFTSTRVEKDRADYGQEVFLVSLNESGEQYDGTIMWDGNV
jgi:hypothetical protein